jgi:hypothetical protein
VLCKHATYTLSRFPLYFFQGISVKLPTECSNLHVCSNNGRGGDGEGRGEGRRGEERGREGRGGEGRGGEGGWEGKRGRVGGEGRKGGRERGRREDVGKLRALKALKPTRSVHNESVSIEMLHGDALLHKHYI